MKLAETLIDNAVKICGSQAELARRVGVHAPDISKLRAGKRTLTPELAALIADEAHMDARQAYIDAGIERDLANPNGGRLANVLGKALAAGVAAVLLFSYADLPISAMESAASELTILHIVLSEILGWIQVTIVTAARRVPHCFQAVKGKAFGSVLTRSHSGVRLPCGPLTA